MPLLRSGFFNLWGEHSEQKKNAARERSLRINNNFCTHSQTRNSVLEMIKSRNSSRVPIFTPYLRTSRRTKSLEGVAETRRTRIFDFSISTGKTCFPTRSSAQTDEERKVISTCNMFTTLIFSIRFQELRNKNQQHTKARRRGKVRQPNVLRNFFHEKIILTKITRK